MPDLILFKAVRDTRLLRKGQKCWARWTSGALAARALTKYHGRGRWINLWVHWGDPDGNGKAFKGGNPDVKWIGRVPVTDKFYAFFEKLGGL